MKAAVKECPSLQFGPGPPPLPSTVPICLAEGLVFSCQADTKKASQMWGCTSITWTHTPPRNQKMFSIPPHHTLACEEVFVQSSLDKPRLRERFTPK